MEKEEKVLEHQEKNVDKTYFVFYKFRESDDDGIQSSIIDILLIFKNKDEYIIPKIEGKVDNSIFYNRDSFGIKNYNINNQVKNYYFININQANHKFLEFLALFFNANINSSKFLGDEKLEYIKAIIDENLNKGEYKYVGNEYKNKKNIIVDLSRVYQKFKFVQFLRYNPTKKIWDENKKNIGEHNVLDEIHSYLKGKDFYIERLKNQESYDYNVQSNRINLIQNDTMQKNKKEINDLLNRINDKNKLSRTRNPVYWNSSYIPMNNQEEFEIEVNPLIFEMTGSEWNGKLGNYLKFTEFKDENGTYKPVMEFNDDSVEKEIRKYFTNNILPNQINSINTQQTQGNSNSQNPDTSAQPSDDFNAFMVFLYGENDKKKVIYY